MVSGPKRCLPSVLFMPASAPLAKNGTLDVHLPDSSTPVSVRIKQLQLEQVLTSLFSFRKCHDVFYQDTAKSTFSPRTLTSNIDLNRAGTGLMEIVTFPDLRSPEEAGAYVRTLQALLRAVGSSDGNMEEVRLVPSLFSSYSFLF